MEETDVGQSRFGHPDLTNLGQSNFGQSIFGHRGFGRPILAKANFGQSNFGQSNFGQSNFGQSNYLANIFAKPRKSGGPEGWGPEGWGNEGWSPERWGPKISRLFFPLPPQFSFFSPSLLVFFVEFWWCLKRRGAQICTFGVLGLSCASPGGPVWWGRRGFTRLPESPNVHI